jgi:pyridoxamine 5'-phosphate oxidase
MQKDLSDYRKTYNLGELLESQLPEDPFSLFELWFDSAEQDDGVEEPNAMTIATIGPDGYPKNRVVLLKQVENGSFSFYTNYTSEKGNSIAANPKVSLNFFWPSQQRQIIIKGVAEKLSRKQSEEYFHSRPRGSQIGAWASDQSDPVPSREYLEEQIKKFEDKFKDQKVPLPADWGGYGVRPETIEFWQGRENRMHDRIIYRQKGDLWIIQRLAP